MALGEHLRTDQQAGFATVDGAEQLFHGALARGAVAVDAQHRKIGKQDAQTLLGALGPGTDGAQIDTGAFGAVQRRPFDMAAMVAAQFVVALMQSHARIAPPALAEPAAIVAEQRGGEAAPVEKHQHLLARGQGLRHGLLQGPGNTRIQRPALDVQAQEAWWLRAPCALRQLEQGVASGMGVVQAFQRGGGGAQQDRQVFLAGAHHRQITCVVAKAFLLFVGGVVLLVEDDQARILQRCEQRRARADDDVRLAITGGQPGIQSLTIADVGVQQGDAGIEAFLEARQGLRPQIDLRDQDQRLFARLEHLVNQLQIHLGLAAAGHAGQQEWLKPAEAGPYGFERCALLVVERQFRLQQPGALMRRGDLAAPRFDPH